MLSVLSLFAGAGGFDIGFERTGLFHSVACIDSDKDCIATLNINRAHGRTSERHGFLQHSTIICGDLARPGAVLSRVSRKPVDVIVGGPPCQAFSVLGKRRGTEDERGGLVASYMDVVERVRPRAFVMENVPGFTSIDSGRTFDQVLKRSIALGYECWSGKLCAADYGDPTIRRRFFLIGVIDPQMRLHAPQATHGAHAGKCREDLFLDRTEGEGGALPLYPYVTVSEALCGLGNPRPIGETINAHVAVGHRASTIERFKLLQPGERDVARRRNRLKLDSPALTLFSGGIRGRKQARTHIHPVFPRELTPRECARLHSFPDYWEFHGPTDSVLTQISNSVPINLGSAVARMVAAACGTRRA
jgi:DNA (cytosine-5)-methyltransferase 1